MKKRILIISALFLLSFFYFWILTLLGQGSDRPTRDPVASDSLWITGWKFLADDDPAYALPQFPDSGWMNVRSDSLPAGYQGEPAWFRKIVRRPEGNASEGIYLMMSHYGASEIYLDGKKLATFGKISADVSQEQTMVPDLFATLLPVFDTVGHVLAVRYSNLSHYTESKSNTAQRGGFHLSVLSEGSTRMDFFRSHETMLFGVAIGIFLITLSFVHALLYLFYRAATENLYYSLFVFFYASLFLSAILMGAWTVRPELRLALTSVLEFLAPLVMLSLQLFVQRAFDRYHPKWLWIVLALCGATWILDAWGSLFDPMVILFTGMWLMVTTLITLVLGTYKVWREKRPGSRILATGTGIFASFLFIALSVLFYSQSFYLTNPLVVWPTLGAVLSIPIAMSTYLAYDFSFTNRSLKQKLEEVEQLSARSIRQEREKQEILARQKDLLEVQVAERTREVVEQKKVIEEKNKDITDSINYARRIQEALLPSDEQVARLLPDSFVFYRPKDIVSGDFYFISEASGRVIVAAVDCTGHGVPGAFMSMMGYNHLRRIVTEQGMERPFRILDELHSLVLHSLNRDMSRRDSKDGMDVAMVSIDRSTRHIEFAGAVRPLYYFDDTGFHDIRGDRYSIGGIKEIGSEPYTSTGLVPQGKAEFYLFSDGFADQFGGPEHKKLMTRKFKEILDKIHGWPMAEQKKYLSDFFDQWKGSGEQMDDILVIGFRI